MAASKHTIEPEVHNGVSTLDEPSAAWGWHDIGKRPTQIAGWLTVFALLGLNFGNHEGHVETVFLLVIAGLIAIGLLINLFEPKGNQVRTVTACNKPVGHIEPEWAIDQQNRTGAYACLTESQQRSWNWQPVVAPVEPEAAELTK